MYRDCKLGLLVRLNPAAAAKMIVAAYVRTGSEVAAAKSLGCGLTSIKRWTASLMAAGHDIRGEIERREKSDTDAGRVRRRRPRARRVGGAAATAG